MIKSQQGIVTIGVSENAKGNNILMRSELFADFCCLLDSLKEVLGEADTIDLLTTSIDHVFMKGK